MKACILLLALTWPVGGWIGVIAPACPEAIQLKVVYNCVIWPEHNWQLPIRQHLENLASIGLADCANIHVVTSISATHAGSELTNDQLEDLLLEARELVASVLPMRHAPGRKGTIVSQVHEHSFEYPGLHLLWTLAQVTDS